MPGLVPGIHAEPRALTLKVSCNGAAWMAGTSPAMTTIGCTVMKSSRTPCTLEFRRTAPHKEGGDSRALILSPGSVSAEAPFISIARHLWSFQATSISSTRQAWDKPGHDAESASSMEL